jgi:hypothetical protein
MMMGGLVQPGKHSHRKVAKILLRTGDNWKKDAAVLL